MKIEYSENVNKYIKDVNNGLINALFVGSTEDVYCIKFKATDLGKANAFVSELLKPHNNNSIQELGIDTISVGFSERDNQKDEII